MTDDDYHSVTCLRDCDGWPCDCPCHDDGGMWDDELPTDTGESGGRNDQMCDNGNVSKETAPAGNRGLTSTTDWES